MRNSLTSLLIVFEAGKNPKCVNVEIGDEKRRNININQISCDRRFNVKWRSFSHPLCAHRERVSEMIDDQRIYH